MDPLQIVHDQGIRYIDLQFTDVVGAVKSITIPANELRGALESGIWFDGSALEGYARLAESDMHLRPDPSTFAVLPWMSGSISPVPGTAPGLDSNASTARLICDIYTPDGQPFGGDARAVLRRAIAQAAEMGFNYYTGPELEFFLLRPNPDGSPLPVVPYDQTGYFDAPSQVGAGMLRQMAETLKAFGIEVDAMHHEIAPGQLEIDLHYSDSLQTADSVVTFRLAVKAIAQRSGLASTFLPKPFQEAAGSGMHVHQSLRYLSPPGGTAGKNAFADPGDPHGLSTIAKSYIAGQLAHARALCAVLAPLVNSYKRISAGYEAPFSVNWARINRTALIRVPRASGLDSTRLEMRMADPSCNPYLAFAAMLAAGLDGIRRNLTPPPAAEERLYNLETPRPDKSLIDLPHSLNQAIDALVEDEVIQAALGPVICEKFISAKRMEWDEYRKAVTQWELEKYLPLF
jgi:glutamine synthetase